MLVVVLGLSSPALCQRYLVHTYGEVDGLPSSNISDLAEDGQGRIWCATRQHLTNYDGVEWRTPLFDAGQGIEKIQRVLIDENDTVWAIPEKAKNLVACRLDGSWRRLPRLPGVDLFRSKWTAADTWNGTSGQEFIGAVDGTLAFRSTGSDWTEVTWPAPLDGEFVTDLEPRNGALYVATTGGIYRVERDLGSAQLIPGTAEARVAGLHHDPQTDFLWILTDSWLGRLAGDHLEVLVPDLGIGTDELSRYKGPVIDGLGNVILAGPRHVLLYETNGTLHSLNRTNGLAKEGATALLCTRDGNVWIGSYASLSKLVDMRLATADRTHGLFDSEVTAILQRQDGRYVLGHRTGLTLIDGVESLGGGALEAPQQIPLDVPNDTNYRLLDIEEGADGKIWLALQGRGLGYLDGPNGLVWLDDLGPYPKDTISVLRDAQGRLWVSQSYALCRLEGGDLVEVEVGGMDSGSAYYRKLHRGREGRVLVATAQGLIAFEGDTIRRWKHPTNSRANSLYAALDARDGRTWIGSAHGLYQATEGVLAPTALRAEWMDRPMYFLLEDEEGNLWCGTDNGVVRWHPEAPPESARRFTVEDGLAGRETNRDAGLLANDGDIWVGTGHGLTIHRQRYEPPPQPPPHLRLLSVDVNGLAKEPNRPISIPAGSHVATFRFRGTGLRDENRLEFRYRLVGYEDEWQGPQAVPAQSVRYTNLLAGSYRFELQTRGHDTPWSPVVSTAKLTVARPLWKRPWFLLGCLVMIVGACYATLRDLARRRWTQALEAEVEQRLNEVRKLEAGAERGRQLEALGVLAGGIAHGFNNLLTVMTGSFSLLESDENLDEEQKAICSDGLVVAERARVLTQQLLTFSQGGSPLVRLGSIAEVLRGSASFMLRDSSVTIQTELPDDLWMVETDPDQIGQVVGTLLLNAAQASEDTGKISVRAWNKVRQDAEGHDRRTVEVEIEDYGCGIAPEHLSRIFDPYYSTKEGCIGLGLTTSHSIVQRHGGEFAVESVLGKGTRMRFSVSAASEDACAPVMESEQGFIERRFRVLVMDDDLQVREIFGKMLELLGHEVTFACDGEGALSAFTEARDSGRPFDISLLDLTIPGGLGGRETALRLLELEPETKMIVVSGYSNDPVLANYQDHGFCARLAKPVSLEDLEDALAKAVERAGSPPPRSSV
jgi:signal transduction histidine kinase/ligand-binding sensor domain-containing protein/CheY-like chemotaxis protein